jgi:ubiquinone/menaquinone biosynthesis C-methylase UbiE
VTVSSSDSDDVVHGELKCGEGHVFAIRNSVADFNVKPQQWINTWPAEMSQEEYGAMLRDTAAKLPAQYRNEMDLMAGALIGELNTRRPAMIVDAGTGSAFFARELVARLDYTPALLVCVDLSHGILVCNQRAIQAVNRQVPLACLAASLTDLPLKDGCISAVVSFGGISNMSPDRIPMGITELHRIMCESGVLIDSNVLFKVGSKTDQLAQSFWREKELLEFTDSYNTAEGIEKIYCASPFGGCEVEVLYAGIAGERPGDLIPVRGDWYAVVKLVACK